MSGTSAFFRAGNSVSIEKRSERTISGGEEGGRQAVACIVRIEHTGMDKSKKTQYNK